MKNKLVMNKKIIFIVTFFNCLTCFSQIAKTINKLDIEHQKCLDNVNNNMANCTFEFYTKMDNLLNTTYKSIKLKLNKTEQQKLKKMQIVWLKKRVEYFKKTEKETAEELDGDNSSQDYKMICTNENAIFVKNRIIELDKIYRK
ncbi:lysozyme inhibitor LprI family protein [Flavobacterium psychrotolerans]|uniref:Lysozyme inhibitor LprI-like N-terminal domain-containing protein n=1 Tax=Flavobacterium psychrotolerans TaxID=2169410 RepID=A0A2U1JIF0_9FLAO|nr:lysozyme inhibitor LprI family protein [Flavobacterium psychrotolerans]PWA04643.1 hypothetical protein DB895_10305 [Flavobacterium psychrotolerans]